MFFDNLNLLCAENGITVTELMKTLGKSPSSASRWKAKGFMPSKQTAKQIADYFGITVRELMEGQKEAAPSNDEAENEMAELLETIRHRPELRVLFSLSKNATPDDVRKTIQIIKTICGDDDGDNYNQIP
ncbi:helix-turn-helix domain-containing protein [Oscillibacter sp.]|uniref:helix-turn-helix domain-containing protein n=1 Tax=Oscillibacter sp. TaxID=1945593 RepID=UPI0028A160EA|nr:helix-turn-helix domain-containing protein [Oscillibacter sp.]